VFLSHSFGFRDARKPVKDSKDSDDSLVSKNDWAKKMAGWVGAQGKVNLAKKANTCPIYDVTHTKPQIQTEKILKI